MKSINFARSYFIAISIALLLIFSLAIVKQYQSKNKLQQLPITVINNALSDTESKIFFGLNNIIYKLTLDGSDIVPIYTADGKIDYLKKFANSQYAQARVTRRYINTLNQLDKKEDFQQILIHLDTEDVDIQNHYTSFDFDSATNDTQITGEKLTIGMQLYKTSIWHTEKEPISILKSPLIKIASEFNQSNLLTYPTKFIASFDNSLIFASNPGSKAILMTLDGRNVFPLDFFPDDNSYIWVDNAALITTTFSESKKYTIENNKLKQISLSNLTGNYKQFYLSPDKQWLITKDNSAMGSIGLFHILREEYLQSSALQSEVDITSVIGWNSQSSKFAYLKKMNNNIFGLTIYNLIDDSATVVATFQDKNTPILLY